MAEGQLTMFGKTYNTVGSADNNLILQTKGDLKIRWGNKFIDLIKNGKINVETNVLKKAKSKNDLSADGIYLISTEEGDEVWARINGSDINITGDSGNDYISYVKQQNIDAEGKLIALSNIGVYYNTLQDARTANVQTGIIYIIDEGSLYYVKEGNFQKFAYEVNIPNPLQVGNITINGDSSTIYGSQNLYLGSDENTYISLASNKITLDKPLSLDVISSKSYERALSGYSLYTDDNNLSCLEIDYILVRNRIEYQNVIDVTYYQLTELIREKKLRKGCKYRISDFQNEWEINHEYLNSQNKKYYHYWPVTVTAASTDTLEEYGYYCDNENWIIKYNINFHYYVYSTIGSQNEVNIFYTKGRITYLKDEFGNIANFDFKHKLFKYNINSDDRRTWLFTYNASNPNYNNNVENPMEFSNIHTNRDYSLTGDIHDNIIYIKEPYFETQSVTIAGQTQNIDVLVIPDEYIIFTSCEQNYPYNNIIYQSNGKYIISEEFHNNIIGGFIQNIQNVETILIHFPFYKNTLGRIYFYGEEQNEPFPTTSQKRVAFSNVHTFNNNTIGDITNTYFGGNFTKNICQNIIDSRFDIIAENNFFQYDLNKVYFNSKAVGNRLQDNIFNGNIITNNNPNDYIIQGNIVDNTFGLIIRTAISGDLNNNRFNNIIPLTNSNNIILSVINVNSMSNCTFNNLIGVRFNNSKTITSMIFYDEVYKRYYDITDVEFNDDITQMLCKGNMSHATFNANVSNVKFGGQVGNNSNIIFNTLTNVEFKGNVLVIDATGSTIENCIFDGNVNNAVIRGTITNNTFKHLSGGVQIGGTNETIDSVVMQTNLSPGIAEYVESGSGSGYTSVNPFSLTTSSIPKLLRSGVKTCYIQTISNQKIFFVQTAADDTTPRGVIVMFNGQINEIPNGYVICDGNNGTPDLRGRFIRMVGQTGQTLEAAGAKDNNDLVTNGNGTRQAYLNKVPAHTHQYTSLSDTFIVDTSGLSINSQGSVTHNLSFNASNINLSCSSETISYLKRLSGNSVAFNEPEYDAEYGSYVYDNSSGHSHTISASGTVPVSGSISIPSYSLGGSAYVDVNFTPQQDTNSENFQEKINIEPQAYALIFIMRV